MEPVYQTIQQIDPYVSGELLREYRRDHNISLNEVAVCLNKSVTWCSTFELGKTPMTEKNFNQYKEALYVLSGELLQDSGSDKIDGV